MFYTTQYRKFFAHARITQIALTVFSAAIPVSAFAEGAPVTLPEVQVTATETDNDTVVAKRARTGTKTDTPIIETPQAISVVTREQLDQRNVQRVTDALYYVAGAATAPYGADPRYDWLFMRGFTSTTLGNYRDGLRQITPACCFSVYRIDPYEMERIEVIKGASSVLYGQISPGGIVNRVSKLPTPDHVNEVQVNVGNFNRKQVNFDLGGRAGEDKNVDYRLVGVWRDSETQFIDVRDDRRSISPSITFHPSSATSLTLQANYLEDRNGIGSLYVRPGNSSTRGTITSTYMGDPSYSGFWHRQYSAGYQFSHAFNDAVTFRQNLRYSDITVDYRTLTGRTSAATALQADGRTLLRYKQQIQENQNEFVVDNQLETKFKTGAVQHTTLVGLDYLDVGLNAQTKRDNGPNQDLYTPVYGLSIAPPTTVIAKNRYDQDQTGLYLQDQIKLADPRWILTLGGRYDVANTRQKNTLTNTLVSDQQDSAFTKRIGLTYLADNGIAPYVSYSESFLPTVGTDYQYNLLKPTTGEQYEVGVKYQPANVNLMLTAAVFDLRQKNVATADPDATHIAANPNAQVQVGEVKSQGIELEAATKIKGIDLVSAFTYNNVVNSKSTTASILDKHPAVIPKLMASVWASYTLQGGMLDGLSFGGGARYTGTTAANVTNSVWNPSFTIFDAMLSYKRGAWRYGLNINNLTNKQVVTCYADTACNYGIARTVIANVRYQW